MPADSSAAWHWQALQLAEDPLPDVVEQTLAAITLPDPQGKLPSVPLLPGGGPTKPTCLPPAEAHDH